MTTLGAPVKVSPLIKVVPKGKKLTQPLNGELDANKGLTAALLTLPLAELTGRWAALVLGILYGSSHYRSLRKRETLYREEEAKLAVIRESKLVEEKAGLSKIEMEALAEAVGMKIHPS